jgi:hypothetical protein
MHGELRLRAVGKKMPKRKGDNYKTSGGTKGRVLHALCGF